MIQQILRNSDLKSSEAKQTEEKEGSRWREEGEKKKDNLKEQEYVKMKRKIFLI